MRKVTRALVGAVVTGFVAAAVGVYAETPTEAHFVACNTDARAAMEAGSATPTTKDYLRVDAARKNRAGTSTESDADPQLVGMAKDGITDAAYQATYRTCMRRNGF
jgi:hypothetical protein